MPTKFGPWKSGPGRAPFTYSYQGTSSTGEFNCYLTNLTSSIILVILVLHPPPSQDFVKNLVTDGLGVELNNKVNEMNLILANHISDKVIDDVIDNLSR